MSTIGTAYAANDNVLTVTVTDSDGVADTGATVTVTTYDSSKQAVESNLSLSHTTGGAYTRTLDETAGYVVGGRYTARGTVVGSNNENGSIDLIFDWTRRTA